MTSTRVDALLDAAEDEFADTGFEVGSLRKIMRRAGADPGAVHYHFGSREALTEAVLDRVLAPLNRQRLQLLDHALAHPDDPPSPTSPQLVEALIRPDIETAHRLHGRSPGRARLIAAIYLRPADFVESTVAAHFAPVAEAFGPHLRAALPHVEFSRSTGASGGACSVRLARSWPTKPPRSSATGPTSSQNFPTHWPQRSVRSRAPPLEHLTRWPQTTDKELPRCRDHWRAYG